MLSFVAGTLACSRLILTAEARMPNEMSPLLPDSSDDSGGCPKDNCCDKNNLWVCNGCYHDELVLDPVLCEIYREFIQEECVNNLSCPRPWIDDARLLSNDFTPPLSECQETCGGTPSPSPQPSRPPSHSPQTSRPSPRRFPTPIKQPSPEYCPEEDDFTFLYEGVAGVICETISFFLDPAQPSVIFSYSLAGSGNNILGNSDIGLTMQGNSLINQPGANNYIFVAKAEVPGCNAVFKSCLLDCVPGGPQPSSSDPPYC